MPTLDDFWIAAHNLTSLLEQAGGSSSERAGTIAQNFHAMSPVARQELLRAFDLLTADLAALAPMLRHGAPTGRFPRTSVN
jgi:hypothetical protein